jgi:hypothetical protein
MIIGVAYGSSLADNVANIYKSLAGSSSQGSGGYQDEYGGKNCYPTYETKYKEQCEDYHEKVCYTSHKESCEDVQGKKCKAIKSSNHERKCYDVTELLCSLKESVQYEEIPAVFTVQKCQNVKERVCDTVYGTELTERDDFECVHVTNPYCALKEHTVYDKTCRTLVTFDCKAQGYGTYDSHAADSHGTKGYGSSDNSYDAYGSSEYTVPEAKCKRNYETKCYTTPRTVSTEYCEDREEKVCEKLTEKVPVPSEKQNCHDENKKVCELEQRSQPKQVKKYIYTKDCRPVPKTVCDNAEQMFLQASCVPSSRKVCKYHPEEKCENVPKQHCHKIPYQVKKMECTNDSGSEGGYEAKSQGSDYSIRDERSYGY